MLRYDRVSLPLGLHAEFPLNSLDEVFVVYPLVALLE
jgi:hypothetical protein